MDEIRHLRHPPLFVRDASDAQVMAEAAVAGLYPVSQSIPVSHVETGVVFVVKESGVSSSRKMHLNDGLDWSPARSCGRFQLYRQVRHIGLDPHRALREPAPPEECSMFKTKLRPNTMLIPNGLAKRSIVVSTGTSTFRVISYFKPHQVYQHYNLRSSPRPGDLVLQRPSQLRMLQAPKSSDSFIPSPCPSEYLDRHLLVKQVSTSQCCPCTGGEPLGHVLPPPLGWANQPVLLPPLSRFPAFTL
ncbi:hypothetical protein HDU79_000108 [Rhizoclosmatium sp. JEL0117]|nr:hypothetical protein HDU79_000108 [Rhizoclosmatium sp. JEL0117]